VETRRTPRRSTEPLRYILLAEAAPSQRQLTEADDALAISVVSACAHLASQPPSTGRITPCT
jgi:hypothetical protein